MCANGLLGMLLSFLKDSTVFAVLPIPVLQGHDPHKNSTGPGAQEGQNWGTRHGHEDMRVAPANSKSSIIGRRRLLQMAISTAPELPGSGRVDLSTRLEMAPLKCGEIASRDEVWHQQQGMMSVWCRKTLQSVGFRALYAE